jgi:hypothetical protein
MTWLPITVTIGLPGHVPELTILHDVVLLKKIQDCGHVCHFRWPSESSAAIDSKTVFVETIGNPKYIVSPISEITRVCDLYVCVHILRWYAGCTRTQSPANSRQYVWYERYVSSFLSRLDLPLMDAIVRVSNSSPRMAKISSCTARLNGSVIRGNTIAGVVISSA